MIQSFHRFLVDNLATEGDNQPYNPPLLPQSESANASPPSPITQLFGVNTKNLMACMSCKTVREKENLTHVIDILYPRKVRYSIIGRSEAVGLLIILSFWHKQASPNDQPPRDLTSIIRSSITRELTHKATCPSCKRFTTFVSRRAIAASDYPPILAFNAGVHNDEDLDIWLDNRAQRFIKPEIELSGDGDDDQESGSVAYEVRVSSGFDYLHSLRSVKLYAFQALVVHITGKDKRSHLVAIIKGLTLKL
jgi:PAB-dependent poly(A)-specific ribonuclease subunit 2